MGHNKQLPFYPVGNRLTHSEFGPSAYDAANRLQTFGAAGSEAPLVNLSGVAIAASAHTYTFDPAGRWTAFSGFPYGNATLRYSPEGQLVHTNTNGNLNPMRYDVLGRLVLHDPTNNGDAVPILWEGHQRRQSNGYTYAWGPGVDEALAFTSPETGTQYVLTDVQGSVVCWTNPTGQRTQTVAYRREGLK